MPLLKVPQHCRVANLELRVQKSQKERSCNQETIVDFAASGTRGPSISVLDPLETKNFISFPARVGPPWSLRGGSLTFHSMKHHRQAPREAWVRAGPEAGAGCSPRPKYQAVLPIQTGSLVAAAKEPTPWAGDKGGAAPPAATASDPAGPPPLPLPGPPPLAPTATAGTLAASEGRWKSMRKSPLGGGGGSGASSQAACLKQILLLQLDLIEQQQQQLQAKEKEIEELKSERDTVREGLICSSDGERVVRMLGGRGL
ncbi:Male-specific lethal 1-like [Cricetulus griseus]|uniref:Male-specific lethal 1 homolog n=1 Tax=Cricetulus griseus TaxID=10029 RepID=G3I5M6_CRIGR|nr:Male-specific lethal 1-like [Cricetulus griseus]